MEIISRTPVPIHLPHLPSPRPPQNWNHHTQTPFLRHSLGMFAEAPLDNFSYPTLVTTASTGKELASTPSEWLRKAQLLYLDNESMFTINQVESSGVEFTHFLLLRVLYPIKQGSGDVRGRLLQEGWI